MTRGGGAGVLVLTVLAALAALTAVLMPWYGMSADGDTFFAGRGNTSPQGDGQPAFPPLAVDVPLYQPAMLDAFGRIPFDPDEAGHIEQVTRTTRFAWGIGALALIGTLVGLVARTASHEEHNGLVASLGVVTLVLLGFATIHFATGIADGLNGALEERYGQAPDLAFFTLDGPPSGTESNLWAEVDSAPGPGWWAAVVAVLALAGALVWSYLPSLRDLGHALGDDVRSDTEHANWPPRTSTRSAARDSRASNTGPRLGPGQGPGQAPRDFRDRIRGGGSR